MWDAENRFLFNRFTMPWIVNLFHRMYYCSHHTWLTNTFLGYPIWQNPMDLQIYQELIAERRPSFILQTGVKFGGSILYFASMLDLIAADPSAIVVGIDIELSERARTLSTHPRIRLIEGSSTDPAVVARARSMLPTERGMVVLDSEHREGHVFQELMIYRSFVERGQYLVAEDTNVNGHPVFKKYGPGPFEAVERFLEQDGDFVRDDLRWRGKLFSFHQNGWLTRL